ncbi:hypothetical protein ABFX02_13G118100 [Erythranthe guttata]
MSKKKTTMTLKDFHGGSIPSDLPLPSAPGITARPVDRGSGFDRQLSWGNSAGRSDNRLRPASAGSVRNLDEKTHFLNHSPHIGRNFDEDERKPLDGVSGPRRTVTDESSRAQTSPATASIPASHTSSGSTGSSYARRVSEVHNARLNTQTSSGGRGQGSNYLVMSGNAGQVVAGSTNAWGMRKETAGVKEHVSAADAETKLAHASALEMVGRWSLKQPVNPLKDAGQPEIEGQLEYNANNIYNKKIYNTLDVVGDSDRHDVALTRHAERSLAVDDGILGGGKEKQTNERVRSIIQVESQERKNSFVLPSESSERPKLKLLPRSKPMENLETSIDNKQQGYERTSDQHHVEDNYVVREPKNPMQSDVSGSVVCDRAPERPKLNLKPRSPPLEQLKGKSEVKRGTVFGGARPRELVLKERGVDDDVSTYESQPPLRAKESSPKADTFTHATHARHGDKAESNIIPIDQRTTKYQVDGNRIDSHRKSRQNETWRNNEKPRNQQQQKQVQERAPSPETWRKPVEPHHHEKPASTDAPIRYGKAASAVELAQAFSKKSVSDPTVEDRFSGLRGIPNQIQIPFSRLTTGSSPRPQINGY